MRPHEMSKVLSDFLLAVPFLEVVLVQQVIRGEAVSFASICNIVMMQLARDNSIFASPEQLGCGIWKLVQL